MTHVLGVAQVNGVIKYIFGLRDTIEKMTSKYMEARKWSKLVFEYLLNKIEFLAPLQNEQFVPPNRNSGYLAVAPTGQTPEIICKNLFSRFRSFLLHFSTIIHHQFLSI